MKNEKKEKTKKKKKKLILTGKDKRTIAITSAIIVVIAAGIALTLAMRTKPVKTDTGKFYIVEEDNYSSKITLTIEGEVPSKYRQRIEIPEDNDVYTIETVSEEEGKVVYEIFPKNTGAETLDFYYETPNGSELYTKLHYTVEVTMDGKGRLLTLNVTDPENGIDGPIKQNKQLQK